MTIDELAEESGLPTSTIRYWEKMDLLPKTIMAASAMEAAP